MEYERPEEPDFFIKPPASLLAHGEPIRYPEWTDELTYAGELVAVIDERCRDVEPADVPEIVRGYTIMNDMDALDQQGRTARKAFDGSGPLGPWIETDVDPTSLDISTTVGGSSGRTPTQTDAAVRPARDRLVPLEAVSPSPATASPSGARRTRGSSSPANASKSPTRASERCRTRSSRESNRERFLKHVRWRAPANARRANARRAVSARSARARNAVSARRARASRERSEGSRMGRYGVRLRCRVGLKGQSPVALPPAARGAKRLAVTGAMRRLQARALLSPCREDEAHRRKDRRKRATRVTEDRSEVRESLAAGALEEFTVDLQSTTYKRAAGVQ